MATKKKLLQAAAGSAGGAGLDVDEVFSTYLYDGTGSAQTITNNIDLSGEGGLVWLKARTDGNEEHNLYDTERGATKRLISHETFAESTESQALTSFNSNGFSVGTANMANKSGHDFVSWTFRKAPKFFDVVQFSGNSTNRTISHNLGTAPGFMAVKRISGSGTNWMCFHRSVGATKAGILNGTNTFSTDSTTWNDTAPTSSVFSLGTDGNVNKTGHDYIAYLWAHNNSDGEFGPDADQDVIKCGSYTGNGSATGPEINLGFEPQWVMVKNSSGTGGWQMMDTMRGMPVGDDDARLRANLADAETTPNFVDPQPTGFQVTSTGSNMNTNGATYIYMAIRRGPLAEPESATDVFAIDQRGGTSPTPPTFTSGFVTDFAIWFNTATNPKEMNYRLSQNVTLDCDASTAEHSQSSRSFDYMNGWGDFTSSSTSQYAWMWKRAPSFCDVVCYSGTGSARTVNHNLGVAPEMMWIKKRSGSNNWKTFHSSLGATKSMELNTTVAAETNGSTLWNSTAPTASVFTVGSAGDVNSSSHTFVAFLFATVAGISKVGSYTGNGSSLTIDCGFSSGAKFVLIKKTSGTSPWLCFDTERGIVTGNENAILLDQTTAQDSADYIDPSSSGFTVNLTYSDGDQYNPNQTNGEYIFYAIA